MRLSNKAIVGIVFGIFSTIFSVCFVSGLGTTVDPGQVGVLVRLGEVQDGALKRSFSLTKGWTCLPCLAACSSRRANSLFLFS